MVRQNKRTLQSTPQSQSCKNVAGASPTDYMKAAAAQTYLLWFGRKVHCTTQLNRFAVLSTLSHRLQNLERLRWLPMALMS